MPGKLGRTTEQRLAIMRNQASQLLWYGRIETTVSRAKELRSYVEKLITKAINSYDDVIEYEVVTKDKKGKEIKTTAIKAHGSRAASFDGEALQRDRSQVRTAQGRDRSGRRIHPHLPARSAPRRRCRTGSHRACLIAFKKSAVFTADFFFCAVPQFLIVFACIAFSCFRVSVFGSKCMAGRKLSWAYGIIRTPLFL